jgi:aminoglycoside phosphotransferase (APT) family kinase protein
VPVHGDEGRPVATDIDARALERWLATRLPDSSQVHLGEFGRPKSGFSAETSIFDAEVDSLHGRSVQRLVLRREVPDPAIYPQQAPGLDVEVDIQYRCMAAVAASGKVPVAPLVGYEADPSVLGAPFFVMGFVDGEVPTESPPYTETGFFTEAAPTDRRRMIGNGLHALAALHTIEWRGAGLDWLVAPGTSPGTARQLDVWEQYARRELAGREHPLLDRALDWLHAHLPGDEHVGLCWGDPRPGNVIWRDFTPACLTDFEAASIASPLQDLGWWLMFDRTMHPAGTRLDGDPDRDEQREMYARAAGIATPDTYYHEVFAAARYAAIVVRVMNRMVARGDLPEEQTIWLHNPAVDALGELMEEQ